MKKKTKITLLLLSLITALVVSATAMAGFGTSPSICLLGGC